MMIQQIAVGAVFLGAVGFVGRLAFRAFQARHACTTGCGKCGAVDFKRIEKEIQLRGLKNVQ